MIWMSIIFYVQSPIMIYSFSHLEKEETSLRVFALYDHDSENPGYIVRAVLIRHGRVHYLKIDRRFRNINAAENYHATLVSGCKDHGYKMKASSRL